jgi:hypothetical protein
MDPSNRRPPFRHPDWDHARRRPNIWNLFYDTQGLLVIVDALDAHESYRPDTDRKFTELRWWADGQRVGLVHPMDPRMRATMMWRKISPKYIEAIDRWQKETRVGQIPVPSIGRILTPICLASVREWDIMEAEEQELQEGLASMDKSHFFASRSSAWEDAAESS